MKRMAPQISPLQPLTASLHAKANSAAGMSSSLCHIESLAGDFLHKPLCAVSQHQDRT